MTTKITVRLVVEGERGPVEDIINMTRRHFTVVEESKVQPIHLRPGIVRRILRVLPPPPVDQKEAA